MIIVRNLLSGRIATYIILLIIGLAIWKANGGDVGKIADTAWEALNAAADTVLDIWKQFF